MGKLASIKRINAAGTTYTIYAVTNSRGDIEELRHLDGSLIARYKYDTWGNTKVVDANGSEITNSSSIAVQNPFRYRGYYYDAESGFYYLQSRYYDPVTCRFVNADGYISDGNSIIGYNMFVYCGNNPINRSDLSGMFWKEVGQALKKVWDGIKTWVNETFGYEASATKTTNIYKESTPDMLPVTLYSGVDHKQKINIKSSKKPITGYVSVGEDLSVGVKQNINNMQFDLSIQSGAVSIKGSYTAKNGVTHSLKASVNFHTNRASLQYDSITWDRNVQIVNYTGVSVDVFSLYVSSKIKLPGFSTNKYGRFVKC